VLTGPATRERASSSAAIAGVKLKTNSAAEVAPNATAIVVLMGDITELLGFLEDLENPLRISVEAIVWRY
jgi:hypothetical protein